ncbi:MAG: 3'-5' exonuclease [Pseudomonadota bacterium]|nr:3'-5' exonuclease [Pseudomonadota bacterium]
MLLSLKRFYHRMRIKGEDRSAPLLKCWADSHFHFSRDWREQDFLVVDTETSALSVDEGELLSIGWVVVSGGKVRLESAEHLLLATQESVGQSASIHLLRDCELEDGMGHGEMMKHFLEVAAGKVLVFHHAHLDIGFLDLLCKTLYGSRLLLPVADTMELEKRKLLRQDKSLQNGALRLSSCRERYGLPDYPAHNALMDALATAELFIGHVTKKGMRVKTKEVLELL